MINKSVLLVLIFSALCFFQHTKAYCQTTTPQQWKQIRANREANERRDRDDRKAADERIKNTKVTSTATKTKENTASPKLNPTGCTGNCIDGRGTFRYSKNQTYFGNWKNGKREGTGEMWYADGNYKGDWKNDLFDGTGTRIYRSTDLTSNIILETYSGEWKEGKRSGSGEETDGDGLNRYVGKFLNDRFVYGSIYFRSGEKYVGGYSIEGFTGFGTLYNSGGTVIYSGEFKNNSRNGKGTATTDDGIYKGIWKNNLLDIAESITNLDGSPKTKKDYPGAMGCVDGDCITGTGEFRDINSTYIGNWSGGKKNGAGVLKSGATSYTGTFVNDLYEGKGILQLPASYSDNPLMNMSNKYEGMFKAGKYEGEGVLTEKGKPVYYGQFKNGLFHGKGRFQLPEDNLFYEGDFIDGLFEGAGIMYYRKGAEKKTIFDGNFKNGKKQGKGKQYIEILALKNMRLVGEWTEGELKGTGTLFNEDGTVYYTGLFNSDYFPADCIGNCQNGTGQLFYFTTHTYFIGDWKDGKWHGVGKEYNLNGNLKFEGQFREGVRHGKGVSYWESYEENHVEAKWVNGKKEGKGIVYYNNGNNKLKIIPVVYKNDIIIKSYEESSF